MIVMRKCDGCSTPFLTKLYVDTAGRLWPAAMKCYGCVRWKRSAKIDKRLWTCYKCQTPFVTERRLDSSGERSHPHNLLCPPCRADAAVKARAIRDGYLVASRDEHARRLAELVKTCEWCQQPFRPLMTRQRFCTKACAQAKADRDIEVRLAELRAATRERNPDRPCDYCGKEYTPKTSRNRFCSKACVAMLYGKRVSVLIEPRARRRAS